MLCLDVVQLICDFCDLHTQIRLIQSCKLYDENIKIRVLVESERSSRVSQKILEQKKFNKLQYLHAGHNRKIFDLNHLGETLLVLICYGENCTIGQKAIAQLKKLRFLDCSYNTLIHDVNHLKDTLETLVCNGYPCALGQHGIKELRLKGLEVRGNEKITDVSHCKDTLTKLDCKFNREIRQECINKLHKLQALNISETNQIRDLSKLHNLKYLAAMFIRTGNLDYDSIKNLENLAHVHAQWMQRGCRKVLYSAIECSPPKS
jgi:Leucine-rich repeat (LRR) protein